MMSAQSSVKSHSGLAIFKWTLKKNFLAPLICFITMVICLPVLMLAKTLKPVQSNIYDDLFVSDSLFTFGIGTTLVTLIAIVLTLVVGCLIFSYMQSKRSLDTFHALPISRTKLFLSRYFAGLVLILLPTLVTMMAAIPIAVFARPFDASVIDLITQTLTLLLSQTATYTMLAFIFVCTGTVVDAVMSLLVINIAWPIAYLIIDSLTDVLVYGYYSNLWSELPMLFSPLIKIFASFGKQDALSIIWWVLFIAVGLFASLRLYNKRRCENVGRSFIYKSVRIMIGFITSLTAGLILGMLLRALTLNSIIALILGFIIGAFLGFLAAHAIMSRGMKGFAKSLLIYAAVVLCFGIYYVICTTGALGFETRCPKVDEIKSVKYYNEGIYDCYYPYFEDDNFESDVLSVIPDFTNEDIISKMAKLDEKIVYSVKTARKERLFLPKHDMLGYGRGADNEYGDSFEYVLGYFFGEEFNDSIEFEFTLKNGSRIRRKYTIIYSDYKTDIKEINDLIYYQPIQR